MGPESDSGFTARGESGFSRGEARNRRLGEPRKDLGECGGEDEPEEVSLGELGGDEGVLEAWVAGEEDASCIDRLFPRGETGGVEGTTFGFLRR